MWAGPGADILCLACLLLQVQAWDAFASGRSLRAIAEDPARLRPLKHATVVGYVVDCALFAAFGGAHAQGFGDTEGGVGAWRTAAASARCAPLLVHLRRAVAELDVSAAAQRAVTMALLGLCSAAAALPPAAVGPHHVCAVPPKAVMESAEVGGRHNDLGIGWEQIKLLSAVVANATLAEGCGCAVEAEGFEVGALPLAEEALEDLPPLGEF